MMMGLRLEEKCVHCGDDLIIYFRKQIPDGPLQCAVVHQNYQTGKVWVWKDLHGFEDRLQVNGPKELSDGR